MIGRRGLLGGGAAAALAAAGAALVGPGLAGCAAAPTSDGPAPAQSDPQAAAALAALLEDSDEAALDRNPLDALWRRDFRRAARFGDMLSDTWLAAERNAADADAARLGAIPRARLGRVDRIAYDTFAWHVAMRRAEFRDALVRVWLPLALDHHDGWHLWFARLSADEGVVPYRTVADFEASLARIAGFCDWLDRAVARAREGIAYGVAQPRHAVDALIGQFARLAAEDAAQSSYGAPFGRFGDAVVRADRVRLASAFARLHRERLQPALARTAAFLRTELRPAARTRDGIASVPGGAAWYTHAVRRHTTTDLAPEAIHRLGLAEVEGVSAGMMDAMRRAGFAGTLPQFFEHLRSDPRHAPRSADELAEAFRAVGRRVDAELPKLIDPRPRTPLAIRPTPPLQAPTDAGARYIGGDPASGEPGVFYFNTHDLASRKLWNVETLYLHEAMPGHHLQGSLASEDTTLPKMLRYDGSSAYWEGWALYAETLGPELGLFRDPLQLFGHHNDQMLRAMRLVVDTGIHAFGWSRERAIDYMLAQSAMSRTEVVAEVERYIANPGQALAYKIGEATIRRLRSEAERTLGARFDIRAFHRAVLDTGAVPLAVLEGKLRDWVAAAR